MCFQSPLWVLVNLYSSVYPQLHSRELSAWSLGQRSVNLCLPRIEFVSDKGLMSSRPTFISIVSLLSLLQAYLAFHYVGGASSVFQDCSDHEPLVRVCLQNECEKNVILLEECPRVLQFLDSTALEGDRCV